MGTVIKIIGANYVNNIGKKWPDFDIRSNSIGTLVLDGRTLSIENTGLSSSYQYAASSSVLSATITMPIASPSAANALVIGATSDGKAILLYLNNTGAIRDISDNGTIGSIIYTIPSSVPNVAKGAPVTITLEDTKLNISYAGYSRDVNYADIPTFATPAIGVIATTNTINTYTFIVN